MIRANVAAYGSQIGQGGLPDPYHSYWIWSIDLKGLPDLAVASIICFADGQQASLKASGKHEQEAFDNALTMLKALPQNQGLQFNVTVY